MFARCGLVVSTGWGFLSTLSPERASAKANSTLIYFLSLWQAK